MAEALITGGLPGLDTHAEDVYRLTYATVRGAQRRALRPLPRRRQSARGGRRAPGRPGRRAAARRVAADRRAVPVDRRHARPGSAGSHELHYLLEDPWDGDGGLSDAFLAEVADRTGFAPRPAVRGAARGLLRAGRRRPGGRRSGSAPEFPAFDPAGAVDGDAPLLFTGEMIYPWMFDLDPALRPLREAAELLARARRVAAAVRPGPARGERGARRGGGLLRRPVRAGAAVAAHRGARSAGCAPG